MESVMLGRVSVNCETVLVVRLDVSARSSLPGKPTVKSLVKMPLEVTKMAKDAMAEAQFNQLIDRINQVKSGTEVKLSQDFESL